MRLYAEEDFPRPTVTLLCALGHDVLTAQEDGRMATSDSDLLERAHTLGRVLLTFNRRHFERLHRQAAEHSGIRSATHDADFLALAARIDSELTGRTVGRWCLRVNRPP